MHEGPIEELRDGAKKKIAHDFRKEVEHHKKLAGHPFLRAESPARQGLDFIVIIEGHAWRQIAKGNPEQLYKSVLWMLISDQS